MRRQVILLLAMLLILGGTAGATPSSQIWIPSTDTQASGTLHANVQNNTTIFKRQQDGGHALPTDIGLTLGVLDTSALGAEIGVDIKEPTDDPLFFNAKLQIKEDSLLRFFPAIAIGGYNFGTKSDETNYNMFYTEIAKSLPVVGRITAGYFVGNDGVKKLRDAKGDKANHGLLLSYDRTMAELDDRLWIAIDHQGSESAFGATSFGMAWRFAPKISGMLGYNIYNEPEVAGKDTLQIRFDMDF